MSCLLVIDFKKNLNLSIKKIINFLISNFFDSSKEYLFITSSLKKFSNSIFKLFSIINRKIPKADLLNAYGSFEDVGISSIKKKPRRVSNLSDSDNKILRLFLGHKSKGPLGRYCSFKD